jgi:tetratricopeptide (TPR) repeat protein
MSRQLTEEEVREHDRVYKQGWSLTKGELLLAGRDRLGRPGWLSRRRLKRALECFEAALQISPDGWPSLWAMGKIHQRLGESAEALGCFARAHEIKPDHPDVAREAGIAASDAGDGPRAVQFTRAAVAAAPNDPGLASNLALALLIDDQIQEAQAVAMDAVTRAPADPIARKVKTIADEVASGKRARPRSTRDAG